MAKSNDKQHRTRGVISSSNIELPNPINSFNSPYVRIRDELDGRQTVKAWVIFKRTIEELKQGSDYKTIVVDLVEEL